MLTQTRHDTLPQSREQNEATEAAGETYLRERTLARKTIYQKLLRALQAIQAYRLTAEICLRDEDRILTKARKSHILHCFQATLKKHENVRVAWISKQEGEALTLTCSGECVQIWLHDPRNHPRLHPTERKLDRQLNLQIQTLERRIALPKDQNRSKTRRLR